jgi:hypothetical protein
MSTALMQVDQKEIAQYAERIRAVLPGGNRLQPGEAMALAQVALAHGLDPFNGEVWFLKDKSGNPIGVMAGIKGHRRAAHRQLDRESGNFWCEFDQLTPEEKKALTIPDNALAFRCRLYDTIILRQHIEMIERLCDKNVPWESVKGIVGERPVTLGYGFFVPGEPTRMKPAACGMKRAEADALKRRFDLPFGSAVGAAQDADASDEATEGEYTVTKPEPAGPAPAPAERTPGGVALFGNDGDHAIEGESEPLEITPETIRVKVAALVGKYGEDDASDKQQGLAVSTLEKCFTFADEGDRQEARHRTLKFLFGVGSSKDLHGCHFRAILDWLHPERVDGKYRPSEQGAFEARMVEHAALLDESQGELFADPLIQAALDMGGRIVEGPADD